MIIIARTRTHFQNNATWKELNIQVDNARQRAKKAAEELKRKKAEPVMETTGKGKEWNVAGKYRISFPAVTENWSTHHELSMTIYMQKTPKGPRMFAEFDFGMLGGYMQFERQQSDNKTKAAKRDAKNPSSKRKRDDVECESDEGDFWDEECRSPTPEQFHLGSIATPSAEHSTWNYRWRGREEGEREIQLSSDQKLNKFKFLDPRGTKIEGTFKCEYFDESKFAGEKIEPEVACKIDISQQWGYLNERAWNRECITRW
ncbi:hypothetical protein F5884DRAFT_669108 [Xylogone sp. PMI_703]|nr:hypothetical protein F5884DRAFT_669108 [Xylogone sp. PMI_703]